MRLMAPARSDAASESCCVIPQLICTTGMYAAAPPIGPNPLKATPRRDNLAPGCTHMSHSSFLRHDLDEHICWVVLTAYPDKLELSTLSPVLFPEFDSPEGVSAEDLAKVSAQGLKNPSPRLAHSWLCTFRRGQCDRRPRSGLMTSA